MEDQATIIEHEKPAFFDRPVHNTTPSLAPQTDQAAPFIETILEKLASHNGQPAGLPVAHVDKHAKPPYALRGYAMEINRMENPMGGSRAGAGHRHSRRG